MKASSVFAMAEWWVSILRTKKNGFFCFLHQKRRGVALDQPTQSTKLKAVLQKESSHNICEYC